MEFNKPVSNPMLLGCIELIRDEDSQEHREMFVEEFSKALFVAPAMVNPAPVEDEEGNLKLSPQSQIQFPMLSTADGKKLYMAFTDTKEYEAWEAQNQKFPMFTLNMQDYANMLLRKDPMGNPYPIAGIVVNPMSTNMIISKELLGTMMARKMAQDPRNQAMMRKLYEQQMAAKAAAQQEGETDAE